MATHAQIQPASGAEAPSLTAFIDRWIYVFMAAMLVAVVLVGFIPDSIGKIAAVEAGERPPFPFAMHVHAVLMGSWMLLLLTQTTLMATGRRDWHMQLGMLGMVLAPALVLAGVVLVPTNLQSMIAFAEGKPPEVQAEVQGFLHFMTNIALIQGRVAICFLLLVYLGLKARKHDPGLHKRLMILATTVPMPAALDRMEFLYHTMPDSPLSADFWPLFCIAPMFLWDLYRQRKIHRAYWIWAAVMVPTGIFVNLAWNSDWWHSFAPGILYG
ncbi:hypothetical protein [Altererythrobacter sp. Z27]|uniref:hypothetical protein n=1 Tax=Altererythrobacter sp. Z27 TaxID=3461147 RepID=UPI00404477BE